MHVDVNITLEFDCRLRLITVDCFIPMISFL